MLYLAISGALSLLLPLWMACTQPVDAPVNPPVDSGYTSPVQEVRLTKHNRPSRARAFMLGLSVVAVAAGVLILLYVGIVWVYGR